MEIVVYYVVLSCSLGDSEEVTEFVGVGNTPEEAKERATAQRREEEQLNCIQYELVGAFYGVL